MMSFETVKNVYKDDSNLAVQLRSLSVQLQTETNITFSAVVCFLHNMSQSARALLSEVVELILVMPATNASSEWSFSALRRIKRTTMT